jgi:hypothetical protein
MTEAELQNCVRDCATLFGWKYYHPWLSVKSAKGYPDCTLVRGNRLIFAELKSARGKVTEAQSEWLMALGAVPGVECYVWTPFAWQSGYVEEVLR